MKKEKKSKYTSIGGSALIEGVMMRSGAKMAIAVRKSCGDIVLKVETVKQVNKAVAKIPVVRGVVSFVMSLITSYKSLMYSADVSMEEILEEEPESKIDKWLAEKLGNGFMTVLSVVSVALGLLISVAAFIYLPTLLADLFSRYVTDIGPYFKRVAVGILKMLIFLIYMLAVSKMKEMRRLFQYHGAEHKTIFCYEAGRELSAKNAREFKRFHPRCGTSFIIITLVVSIVVSLFIPWKNALSHSLLKILLLPIVMGIAYEFIRFAGKHDNLVTRIFSAPGLWFQRITTSEPDLSQLEVAVWAMRGVLEDYPLNEAVTVVRATAEQTESSGNDK